MDFLSFLLTILLGFLLSGIWFGLVFINGKIINKYKSSWILPLNPLLASIIPIFIISIVMGIYPVQIEGIQDLGVYVIAIVTVFVTTAIITRKKLAEHKGCKELLIYALDGVLMEIPQRLMMQSFIYGMLKVLGVELLNLYSIIATAIIWCMGILMQNFLAGQHLDKDIITDVLASFVFSIGIGYVYQRTGFIVITMIAHFSERILSSYVYASRENRLNIKNRNQ